MKFEFTREWISQLKDSLGSGINGAKGEKGDQGIQGEKGLKGDSGAKGAKGDTGKDGDSIVNSNTGTPLKLWSGTQEEYDAILDKDPETLYLIRNVTEVI